MLVPAVAQMPEASQVGHATVADCRAFFAWVSAGSSFISASALAADHGLWWGLPGGLYISLAGWLFSEGLSSSGRFPVSRPEIDDTPSHVSPGLCWPCEADDLFSLDLMFFQLNSVYLQASLATKRSQKPPRKSWEDALRARSGPLR